MYGLVGQINTSSYPQKQHLLAIAIGENIRITKIICGRHIKHALNVNEQNIPETVYKRMMNVGIDDMTKRVRVMPNIFITRKFAFVEFIIDIEQRCSQEVIKK